MSAQDVNKKPVGEEQTESNEMQSASQRLAQMRIAAVLVALIEWYRIETGRLRRKLLPEG